MRWLAVGAALWSVALAGCSDDPVATPLPPVTAEPSPSPTAVALPDPPPDTEGDDAAAATAFARYYIDVVNEAYRTAEPELMVAISDSGCEGCNNLVGQIRAYSDRQETLQGGDFVVIDAAAPADEPGDTVVEILVRQEPARRLSAAGDVLEDSPETEPGLAQLRVVREAGGWKAYGLRFLADEAAP